MSNAWPWTGAGWRGGARDPRELLLPRSRRLAGLRVRFPLVRDRGMTLVEATIVLAIGATLAAVLTPAVGGYLDQARLARAREDLQVIGNAVREYVADNAELQFLRNGSGPGDDQPPDRIPDTSRVNLLVSDGDIPSLAAAVAAETFWTQAVNLADVDTFSNHLVENTPEESGAVRYRNPSDITRGAAGGQNPDFARPSSSGFNAPFAWRGAYLRGPVESDPWGNRYAANVAFLDPQHSTAIAGITAGFAFTDYPRLDVFVICSGADEEIDTRSAQDGAVPGDDDIIYVISSHAK